MNATIRELLDTADLLIENNGGPATTSSVTGGPTTAASRCRGAAFALRAALESAVTTRLTADGAPRTIREGTMRVALLWLRGCVEAETARRAKAVWSQLCLGCHYHQYETGPTEDQVRAWRSEVTAIIARLAH
ncbi:hypothetical protein ACFTZI_13090 [Streptomyces decoyicus]|uniref:hypothetical protein n=1 Tax=Streptomyces decoyicus TaxID=249567 RepID=UPI00363FB611